MVESIISSFDVWTEAQGVKSKGRVRSIENISLEGITHLRELILELAIRGKLVPQDAGDEPASELLKRIEKEKAKAVEEGKLKQEKPLPVISDDEKQFDLPVGWKWVRLREAGICSTGKTPPTGSAKYFGGKIPFVGPGQITQQGNITKSEKTLTEIGAEMSTVAEAGDILMVCIGGSIGKSGIVNSRVAFNQQLNSIRPLFIGTKYINTVFRSSYFQMNIIEKATGSATPIINRGKWEEIPVPVPSITEQHRIVSKVEELMALCDSLERVQTAHLKTHQTLVAAGLQTLTGAANAAKTETAWQRLAPHFDTLFCTEDSIDRLKETVLQLAVMGRLVPQDEGDEPAGALLKKIEKEKAKGVKEGKLKKEKPLPAIREEEKPFELPKGWEWVRLGAITTKIGSGSTPRGGANAYVQSGVIFLRSQNIRNEGLQLNDVVYIDNETNEKMANTIVEPDDILLNITGGSLGRSTVFPASAGEANVSQHVTIIRPVFKALTSFLHLCILSPYVQDLIWGRQVGANREGLSKRILELFEFPLPPLAEQGRIVAKVEELTALCDGLKAGLKKGEDTKLLLSKTIVENAVV